MIILLTMPLGIYSFDTQAGKLTRLTLGKYEYGGLSWDTNSVYLSHSNIDNASLQNEKDYRNATVGIVCAYSPGATSVVARGISQPHQILADSHKRLLISNTGLNRIDVVDLTDGQSRQVYLNNTTCDMIGEEKAGDHFNGFFEHADSLFVVSHNNGRKSKVWQLDSTSFEVVKIYDTEAEWAHNCWVCEHGMLICDSKNGSLYDVYTGETVWKADVACITRGLAANDDFIFVGYSEFGNRRTRKYSAGGFWVIDRKSLQTVDKYLFDGTGCTIEVRIGDEFDYCHKAPPLKPYIPALNYDVTLFDLIADKYTSLRYKIFG